LGILPAPITKKKIMSRWGLIGNPLTHSFSPAYFKEKFRQLGLPDTYDLLDVANLHDIKNQIAQLNWEGFNVTIPHKTSILDYLDEITPIAESIGAVNSIKIQSGKWIGTNTDAPGFEKSILPFLENHFPRALIIGTGGASKAVEFVLKNKGIETWFLSRSPKEKHHLGYHQIDASSLKHFPLIVQTTPLGTYPDIHGCPALPFEGITPQHFLVDLIYNPTQTTFLKEGLNRGAKTQNGLRMLEIQADLSWEFWQQ
jgi:shikimate dehydrogenase